MHIFERLVLSSWKKQRDPQNSTGFARCLPALPARRAKELLRMMRGYDSAVLIGGGTFYEGPSTAMKRSFTAMLIWSAFRVAREQPAVFVFGALGFLPAIVMVVIHLGRRFAELIGWL
jgi:hypothetical protein